MTWPTDRQTATRPTGIQSASDGRQRLHAKLVSEQATPHLVARVQRGGGAGAAPLALCTPKEGAGLEFTSAMIRIGVSVCGCGTETTEPPGKLPSCKPAPAPTALVYPQQQQPDDPPASPPPVDTTVMEAGSNATPSPVGKEGRMDAGGHPPDFSTALCTCRPVARPAEHGWQLGEVLPDPHTGKELCGPHPRRACTWALHLGSFCAPTRGLQAKSSAGSLCHCVHQLGQPVSGVGTPEWAAGCRPCMGRPPAPIYLAANSLPRPHRRLFRPRAQKGGRAT